MLRRLLYATGMDACSENKNCWIPKIKRPEFCPPQNLSFVEHILELFIEDGFGRSAYFERLNSELPLSIGEQQVGEKTRSALPDTVGGKPRVHSLKIPIGNSPTSLVRSNVEALSIRLLPRGSPDLPFIFRPPTVKPS